MLYPLAVDLPLQDSVHRFVTCKLTLTPPLPVSWLAETRGRSPGAEGQVALPEPPRSDEPEFMRGWQLGHKLLVYPGLLLNFPGFSLGEIVAGKL